MPGVGNGTRTVDIDRRIFPSVCGAGFPSDVTWNGELAPERYSSNWYDWTAALPSDSTTLWSADGSNSIVFGLMVCAMAL
jgi:hypothetical protein